MKKLVVLIIAILAAIGGYTTYAYAIPKVIPTSHVVFVNSGNSNVNDNSDADENLPDGLQPLALHKVYNSSNSGTPSLQAVPSNVEPFLGKWVVEKQIGTNPFNVQGKSPIGKTITITQSQYTDNAESSVVSIKDPYYTIITIPYANLTQDYDVNFYDQTGLPESPLNVLIINPSNAHTPIQNPTFNDDALFIDNGNLVVADGLSFFLCKKES